MSGGPLGPTLTPNEPVGLSSCQLPHSLQTRDGGGLLSSTLATKATRRHPPLPRPTSNGDTHPSPTSTRRHSPPSPHFDGDAHPSSMATMPTLLRRTTPPLFNGTMPTPLQWHNAHPSSMATTPTPLQWQQRPPLPCPTSTWRHHLSLAPLRWLHPPLPAPLRCGDSRESRRVVTLFFLSTLTPLLVGNTLPRPKHEAEGWPLSSMPSLAPNARRRAFSPVPDAPVPVLL